MISQIFFTDTPLAFNCVFPTDIPLYPYNLAYGDHERKRARLGKISCLPPKLLAPIFILTQAESESNQHPFSYNIWFEVLLSHVSRFWRAVSLSARPQSLVDIYINLSNWERDHTDKRLSKSRPAFIQSIADQIYIWSPSNSQSILHMFPRIDLPWNSSHPPKCISTQFTLNLRQLQVNSDRASPWPMGKGEPDSESSNTVPHT